MTALACTATCVDCDWTHEDTDMEATDKAAEKHGKAHKHSTSWHCERRQTEPGGQ